jgi:hypothetical protein
MRTTKPALIGPFVAAVALLSAWLVLPRQPVAAGNPLSGSWDVSYALACSASLAQTGVDVTGTVECGASLSFDVTGTFQTSAGNLSLTGAFAGTQVTIAGSLSDDGHALQGSWSAPPLVDNGPFSAIREGDPTTSDVEGLWLIDVQNIFSSDCRAHIVQSGLQLASTVNCGGGLTGALIGAFDPNAGQISLHGTLGSFGSFEMRLNVGVGGNAFHGVWRIASTNGAAGIMSGQRSTKDCGDVNDDGEVDSVDATLILQRGAGLIDQLLNAPSGDLNADGSVNSIDATIVLQYGAGLVSQLSC